MLLVALLNPFLANVPILYPLKPAKNQRFLVFLGGIKWEHWPKMSHAALLAAYTYFGI